MKYISISQRRLINFMLILNITIVIVISGNTSFQYTMALDDQSIYNNSVKIKEPFGICHGYSRTENEVNEMVEQGIQFTRNDISWSSVEKVNNTYDFTYYDTFYNNLRNFSNIEPLAILDYGNALLYGEEYYRYIPNWMIPHWLQYVNETVNHLKDRITYWEIWNEPNIEHFWIGTNEEYFNLLNTTAWFLYNNYPEIKIIAPGISGHNPEYLDAMISFIGDDNFNKLFTAINYHPYSGSNAEIIIQKAQEVKDVVDKHGYNGEIWVTEVGYSTQVESIDLIHEQLWDQWVTQANTFTKIMPILLAANTSRIVWYCYRDWNPINWTYGESNFGIQHYDSNSKTWIYKPTAFIYQYYSKYLSNGHYIPEALSISNSIFIDSSQIYSYLFKTNTNEELLVLWNKGANCRAEITFIDTKNNNKISDELILTQYDYRYNIENQFSTAQFNITLGAAPLVLKISPGSFIENETGFPTIKVLVDLSLNSPYSYLIWIIPMLWIVGLIFLLKNKQSTVGK